MNPVVLRFMHWLRAWVDLFDALIQILSLGFIQPTFSFRFVCWIALYDLKKKQDKK